MSKSNILLTQDDLQIINNNIESINQKLAKKRESLSLSLSFSNKRKIFNIVIDFIIKKRRKVYGGFALNEMLKDIGSNDTFYSEDDHEIHDIDFYTPDPINDLIDLCDIIFKENIALYEIAGREAQHSETYSLFVDGTLYCDLSYVPKNIYNKMPFKELGNKIVSIHPHFMWIDYLRILSEPINSWWRIDKSIERFTILQNNFKLPQNLSPIKVNKSDMDSKICLNAILQFLVNKKTTVVIGYYAYNYLLQYSNIVNTNNLSRTKSKKKGEHRVRDSNFNIQFTDIPYYEFISTDYKNDSLKLLELLRKLFPDDEKMISYVEHYPWFQYTGYSVKIYCKNNLIAIIYDYDKRCIPYSDVVTRHLEKDFLNHKQLKGKIRIGTFSVILLYFMINLQIFRTNNNKEMKELFYKISSHLIYVRNVYLKKNNKSILDNTLFREMEINCTGSTITNQMEFKLKIKQRMKKNKKYHLDMNHQVKK